MHILEMRTSGIIYDAPEMSMYTEGISAATSRRSNSSPSDRGLLPRTTTRNFLPSSMNAFSKMRNNKEEYPYVRMTSPDEIFLPASSQIVLQASSTFSIKKTF